MVHPRMRARASRLGRGYLCPRRITFARDHSTSKDHARCVLRVTAVRPGLWHVLNMETTMERPYKVERTQPDGQRVPVGTFKDVEEAKQQIAAFSEFWPGEYVIVRAWVRN